MDIYLQTDYRNSVSDVVITDHDIIDAYNDYLFRYAET